MVQRWENGAANLRIGILRAGGGGGVSRLAAQSSSLSPRQVKGVTLCGPNLGFCCVPTGAVSSSLSLSLSPPLLSFLVSVLYSKAKLASACGGIIYFLSYVPYMYVAIREEVAHDKITAFEKCIAVSHGRPARSLPGGRPVSPWKSNLLGPCLPFPPQSRRGGAGLGPRALLSHAGLRPSFSKLQFLCDSCRFLCPGFSAVTFDRVTPPRSRLFRCILHYIPFPRMYDMIVLLSFNGFLPRLSAPYKGRISY